MTVAVCLTAVQLVWSAVQDTLPSSGPQSVINGHTYPHSAHFFLALILLFQKHFYCRIIFHPNKELPSRPV